MQILNIVKKYQEKLEEEISLLEAKISIAPEGQLKIIKNRDRYKWYMLGEDGKWIYIKKKDINIAIALALKSYRKRKVRVLKRDKKAIDTYLNRKSRINNEAEKLLVDSEEFSRLVTIGERSERRKIDYVKEWIDQAYEKNTSHPENLTIKTVNGLYVRSKSEAYIAAELASHSIPFRYECRQDICGFEFFPDFTILNPLNEEIILWEHLGMVDDDKYLENAFSKIRLYIKAGYIPSKNLILTYETKDSPLDFSIVQELIRVHFG